MSRPQIDAAPANRSQLLSEGLTQVSLTISLYRLYVLLVELGRRKATKPPALALKVGPCCCWPCLPLPSPEMTDANLSWLRLTVLQFPIVQVGVPGGPHGGCNSARIWYSYSALEWRRQSGDTYG